MTTRTISLPHLALVLIVPLMLAAGLSALAGDGGCWYCEGEPTCASSGQVGTYPDCRAPETCEEAYPGQGYTGTYPDCVPPPYCGDSNNPNTYGTYPSCQAETCQHANPGTYSSYWTGTYPSCTAPTCEAIGYNSGTYPTCYNQTCSTNQIGTWPSCYDVPDSTPTEPPEGWIHVTCGSYNAGGYGDGHFDSYSCQDDSNNTVYQQICAGGSDLGGNSIEYSCSASGSIDPTQCLYIEGYGSYCPTSDGLPTVELEANPGTIEEGESSVLTWSSTNATSCTSSDFTTGGATSGYVIVSPGATADYTVTCSNGAGSDDDTETVTVTGGDTACSDGIDNDGDLAVDYPSDAGCGSGGDDDEGGAAPTCDLTSTPSPLTAGVPTTFTWTSSNATSCTGSGFNTGGATSGTSGSVTPGANDIFQLQCTGAGGTCTDTLSGQASVDISASPTRVNPGGSSAISWTSTGCSTLTVTGSNGFSSSALSASGQSTGALMHQVTYTASCNGGAVTDTVIVNVSGTIEEF